jgi:hypothetical protein
MKKDTKKSPPKKETPMTTNQPPAPQQSVADQIWAKIAHLPFPMFALPGKTVADYCKPVPIDPSRLFLSYKVGPVVPMLEEVLASLDRQPGTSPENQVYIKPESRTYKIDITEKYIIISLNDKY